MTAISTPRQQDGYLFLSAGTFLGRVSLQGLVLTSSFNGEEPSGFAMVLEHDSDRPMMSPKFAQVSCFMAAADACLSQC